MKRVEQLAIVSRNGEEGKSAKSPAKAICSATLAELLVLAEVLDAMREAMRTKHQLMITLDPFGAGGGIDVFITFDPTGYTMRVEGEFKAAPKPRTKKQGRRR